MAENDTQHEPFAVLKIRDFRYLVLGRVLGTVAVQIMTMAVGWQIYELTKNPLMLGLIGLAEVIPAVTVSLYAGHLADVVDRRRIILMCLLMFIVCLGTLAYVSAAYLSLSLLLTALYTLIVVHGFARGFYPPAMFGLVSQIVPRELYGNAAAWNSWAWQGSAILGPVLGGFLYVKFGVVSTYLLAMVLMIACFVCMSLIHSRSDLSAAPKGSVHESIKEGLQFVFSNQIIMGSMALDLFAVLFGGAVALLPIFADQIFHMGPEAVGMLRAAPSLGAFITATTLAFRPIRADAGVIFLAAVAGFGLCLIAFGLSTHFYLSLALLAVSGICDGVSVYIRNTIYQLHTPADMKGRVAAVNSIFISSSNELGEFESGVMAKLMGTVPSVVFGGCMTLMVVVVTAIKAPKLRKLDL